MFFKTSVALFTGLTFSLLLTACGQTGQLYLPKAKASQASSAMASQQGTADKQ